MNSTRSHTKSIVRVAFFGASISLTLGAGCSSSSGGSPSGGGGSAGASGGNSGGGASASGGSGVSSGGNGSLDASAGSGGIPAGGASSGGSTSGASGGSSGSKASGGGVDAGDGGKCCADKACQPSAVQSCVCNDWHETQCCNGGPWDAICQTTAEAKCAAPHCTVDTGNDPTKGACCATHAAPGCSDGAIEACVCNLLPDCCDTAWDDVCVQLVREEHCESGVRDCLCITWQQSTCCNDSWTSTCTLEAEDKCHAKNGCP